MQPPPPLPGSALISQTSLGSQSLPPLPPRYQHDGALGIARQLSLPAAGAPGVVAAGATASNRTARRASKRTSRHNAPKLDPGPLPSEDEEVEKQQRRKERNRETAAASRQRRLDRIAILEERVAELEDENLRLQQLLANLQVGEPAAAASPTQLPSHTLGAKVEAAGLPSSGCVPEVAVAQAALGQAAFLAPSPQASHPSADCKPTVAAAAKNAALAATGAPSVTALAMSAAAAAAASDLAAELGLPMPTTAPGNSVHNLLQLRLPPHQLLLITAPAGALAASGADTAVGSYRSYTPLLHPLPIKPSDRVLLWPQKWEEDSHQHLAQQPVALQLQKTTTLAAANVAETTASMASHNCAAADPTPAVRDGEQKAQLLLRLRQKRRFELTDVADNLLASMQPGQPEDPADLMELPSTDAMRLLSSTQAVPPAAAVPFQAAQATPHCELLAEGWAASSPTAGVCEWHLEPVGQLGLEASLAPPPSKSRARMPPMSAGAAAALLASP